jgi:NCS1 family nucleobase:cation symporter-1
MPDFTRFGRSQSDQVVGQALGLPTTMTLFAVLAVITASAAAVVYGTSIDVFDPVKLVAAWGSPLVTIVALFAVMLATLTTNVAANLVSPSYDLSNAAPRSISFRTGGIITAIVAVILQPWYLISNPEIYIFTWLGFYGGALGAIAGVLIADYWLIRRTQLKLADLYRTDGIYRLINWRGVVALVLGAVLAVGGAYSALDASGKPTGPFPPGGIIGFLHVELPWGGFLYDYSWIIGLVVAFIAYYVLAKVFPESSSQPQMEPAGEMA